MHRLCTTMAIAFAVAVAPLASASAKKNRQQRPPPRPPVITNDPSLFRPRPPLQPERNFYGPAPSIQPPMERVPLPAPLAPPPVR